MERFEIRIFLSEFSDAIVKLGMLHYLPNSGIRVLGSQSC